MATPKEFRDHLLEEKKKQFLGVVIASATAISQPAPPVNFCEQRCPLDTGNELAHIHPDSGIICISLLRLKHMTFEEIKDVASHEVTHLREYDHGSDFDRLHSSISVSTWKPPPGVVVIREDDKRTKLQNCKPIIDKARCNYHLCRKKTTLEICQYCGKYYCKENISPRETGVLNLTSTHYKDLLLKGGAGHPCPDYVSFLERRQKEESDKFMQMLDRIKKQDTPLIEEVDRPTRKRTYSEKSIIDKLFSLFKKR